MKMSERPRWEVQSLGVSVVERRLELAKEQLRKARTAEDFRRVGSICREALLDLEHTAADDAIRSYVKAAALVITRTHSSTDDEPKASACIKATENVALFVAQNASKTASHDTVAELCERFINENPKLGESQRFSILRLSGMPIGKKVASKLRPEDVIEHCQARHKTVSAPTVNQDLTFLKSVLRAARDKWNLDVSIDPIQQAKGYLAERKIVGRSTPRTRRPSREEVAALVDYFEKQDRLKNARIPMREIMEFALFSARRISEICSLRWKDVNEKTRTCIVRGVKDPQNKAGRDFEFPLLGKAWDIVQRQPTKHLERIFPYEPTSASKRYIDAKKKLDIENLRFNDLRREAAIRLYEAGHSVEQISKVTGRLDLNSLLRDVGQGAKATAEARASTQAPIQGEAPGPTSQ